MESIKTRDELKKYFEIGDRPTENQFSQLIDGYVHLNELNFGLAVTPTIKTYNDYYDFYLAEEAESYEGHKIIRTQYDKKPEKIKGYKHILSREIFYKKLNIELIGDIDVKKHQPKIIIKRYRQRKKLRSGYIRASGFIQEKPSDAKLWNRSSEYIVTDKYMELDIEPIHYFKPNYKEEKDSYLIYKNFSPSGSIKRPGSFKYSVHQKTFLPITLQVQIVINGKPYLSSPVALKIILGSAGETDAINFILG